MTTIGWIQILLYCAIIVAIVPVLGAYMTRVFNGERTLLSPVLRPVETVLYCISGVYRNEPRLHVRDRSAIHYGAVWLKIIDVDSDALLSRHQPSECCFPGSPKKESWP